MYNWVPQVGAHVRSRQRMKPSPSSQAPLRPLPVALDVWRSVSMDFVLPADAIGRIGVLVFVDRFNKMVNFSPVSVHNSTNECAAIFLDIAFRLHWPETIVFDRDPCFVA